MAKLNPRYFTEAALLVETPNANWYGCHAITEVICNDLGTGYDSQHSTVQPYVEFLFAVFTDVPFGDEDETNVIWRPSLFSDYEERRTARAVGLHLCANLVQSGFTTESFQ